NGTGQQGQRKPISEMLICRQFMWSARYRPAQGVRYLTYPSTSPVDSWGERHLIAEPWKGSTATKWCCGGKSGRRFLHWKRYTAAGLPGNTAKMNRSSMQLIGGP